ncbi:hypothetical protein [Deefgea sp. CFH1-16]|uniref:hypothetical protein n=1 Tax=Deefgea sp. CFH1-16 TaxID=2675457 RepID=UPI0015F53413|nr:hypothetical protein [Deefgea sp. CFH1-16]MBM5573538.1 hypothetical protein [Deefgea sp. CFH1-16]
MKDHFKPTLHLCSSSGIKTQPGLPFLQYWIIERSLLQFRFIDLQRIPRSQWAATLSFQLPQMAQFQQTQFMLHWNSQGAEIWFCDAIYLEKISQAAGAGIQWTRARPEACCYPRQENGIYSATAAGMHEIQVWQNGDLIQSRWLKHSEFTAENWRNELPQPLQHEPVHAIELIAAPKPQWAIVLGSELGNQKLYYESTIYCFIVGLIFTFAWYLLAQQLDLQQAITKNQPKLQALKQQVAMINQAKASAIQSALKIEDLATLQPNSNPLQLMQVVQKVMGDQVKLQEFDWRPDYLNITMTWPNSPPSDLEIVRRLSEGGQFSEVQVDLAANNSRKLSMKMTPPKEDTK